MPTSILSMGASARSCVLVCGVVCVRVVGEMIPVMLSGVLVDFGLFGPGFEFRCRLVLVLLGARLVVLVDG